MPPSEKLESGVPLGGSRLSRAHSSHESRGSLGGWRGQICREDLEREASLAWSQSSPIPVAAATTALFVLCLPPPPTAASLLYLFSVSFLLSLLPLLSLSLTPLIFLAFACLSLPLNQSPPPSLLLSTLWFPSLQTASLLDKNSDGSSQARPGAR